VLRKIQFEVLLLNANYDDYLKATPTPPPSSAARVCACDVPVDNEKSIKNTLKSLKCFDQLN